MLHYCPCTKCERKKNARKIKPNNASQQLNHTESIHTMSMSNRIERKIMASNGPITLQPETIANTPLLPQNAKFEHFGLRQAQLISLDPFIIDKASTAMLTNAKILIAFQHFMWITNIMAVHFIRLQIIIAQKVKKSMLHSIDRNTF